LVLAFILALGCQLRHKATCRGGGCLTCHSHYVRVRLSGSPFGISSAPRVVRGVGQKTPYWPVKALRWRQHAQSWRLIPARSTAAAWPSRRSNPAAGARRRSNARYYGKRSGCPPYSGDYADYFRHLHGTKA
jgi:hypothetical protein